MTDGNALFLICAPCEQANEPDFGFRMADRSKIGWYAPTGPSKQFEGWLSNHRKCGGRNNPDHFQLGMLRAKNHDQLPLEKPTAVAVQQALDS